MELDSYSFETRVFVKPTSVTSVDIGWAVEDDDEQCYHAYACSGLWNGDRSKATALGDFPRLDKACDAIQEWWLTEPATKFYAIATNRVFRIMVEEPFWAGGIHYTPVVCQDVETLMSAEAIVRSSQSIPQLLGDEHIQDAISSAYMNATTTWKHYKIVRRGTVLTAVQKTEIRPC